MPKSTIDSTLRARVDAFTSEIAELVREEALASIQAALSGVRGPARRGRPRTATTRRKPRFG